MKVTQKTVDENGITASKSLWYGIAFVALYCGLIYVVRPIMPQIDFAEDTGFAHYYWKLPNPTAITRATAWGGYILHQVTIWYFIYYAQKNKLKYTNGPTQGQYLGFGCQRLLCPSSPAANGHLV